MFFSKKLEGQELEKIALFSPFVGLCCCILRWSPAADGGAVLDDAESGGVLAANDGL